VCTQKAITHALDGNKSSHFVGMPAHHDVGMNFPPVIKSLKGLVGAQGFEPWTR
jgi:hypothetical protein